MRSSKTYLTLSLISAVALAALLTSVTARHGTPSQLQTSHVAAAGLSRRPSFEIPKTPPAARDLQALINGPEDIDAATAKLGIEPRLLNYHMATSLDLSDRGLGRVVHIPVQISNRTAGRKSLYYLKPGEEVLAGIFVSDEGVALRYVKRLSGKGVPARTGDNYETRITNRDGKVVYEEPSRIEVTDARRGMGRFLPLDAQQAKQTKFRWIAWSFWLDIETK